MFRKKLLLTLSLFIFFFFNFVITSKASGWGFRKNSNHETPEIGKYQQMIEGTDAYYYQKTEEKCVFLTFDVGYDNGNLSIILDTLKAKNVKANFFITGDFINRFPSLVLRMAQEGHLVCNHSYSHKKITQQSKEELKNDLEKLEEKYYALTKEKMLKFFRPPEGDFSKEALLNLKSLGYKTIFWSIAYKDWDVNNQVNEEKVCKNITDNLHKGAIILLHSVSKTNALALGRIIESISTNEYTFKSLLEL